MVCGIYWFSGADRNWLFTCWFFAQDDGSVSSALSVAIMILNVESGLRLQGGTTDLFLDGSVSSASVSCRRAHFNPSSSQTQTQVKWMHVDFMIDYREIDGTQSDSGHEG